eukprot:8685646-Pyramimonas_sp.AAC.1
MMPFATASTTDWRVPAEETDKSSTQIREGKSWGEPKVSCCSVWYVMQRPNLVPDLTPCTTD